jgi:glucokinase
MVVWAGVDLGGTNVVAAIVDADHAVRARAKRRTPDGGPDAVVDAIVAAVGELGSPVDAVGVGAPGPVSGGVVLTAPNLAGWDEPVPLAAMLTGRLGVEVVVDNDATVGLVGEWVAGAGRGAAHLLGVWLGTGVGGGLVLDGRPYRGAYGGAGELGHLCVAPGGVVCGCGRRGCVEAYAGRAAMERRVDAAVAAGRGTVFQTLRARSGRQRLTAGVWAEALAAGDPLATEVFDEAVAALGAAVAAAVNLLDLDRVVVGGGIAEKLGQPLADRIGEAVRPGLIVPGERTFRVAELGDDSGVIGAAALTRT